MTEEVLPQYEFAESHQQNDILYRTSPAPFGGTLPKGEGFGCAINYNLHIPLLLGIGLPGGGMDMSEIQMGHELVLDQRKKLTMTGVTEVLRFDDGMVVLQTELGILTVLGQELRLKTLSTDGGQMGVTGQISALTYEEPRTGGWLRRLFG